MKEILSEGSCFEVFDRIICRVLGKSWVTGTVSKEGTFGASKGLMMENQLRIINLQDLL